MAKREPSTRSFTAIQRRRIPGLLLIVFCGSVLVCILADDVIASAPVSAPSVLAANLLADNTATKANSDILERHLFGQFLYRNRQQQVILGRVVRELGAGKTTAGLIYLQTLLDRPEDGFVWIGSKSRLTSVRREASRILSSQKAEVLQAYERMYGAEADRLLSEARQTNDPALYREVVRRFFHTAAGFAALNWQATRWLDQGWAGLAARSWDRLIAEGTHRRRVKTMTLFKAALAHRFSGRTSRETKILDGIVRRPIKLGDGTMGHAGRIADDSAFSVRRAHAADWPIAFGHASHSRDMPATTPHLESLWNLSYAESGNASVVPLVRAWERQQSENLRPAAVANSVIVADQMVIVRDFSNLRACNPLSGRTLWTYRCATSMASAAGGIRNKVATRSKPRGRLPASFDVQRTYAGNATLGMLASDGERLYAVDYLDLVSKPSRSGRSSVSTDISIKPPGRRISREANRLIALKLEPDKPGDSVQQPIWMVGGPVTTPDWFLRMDRNDDGRVVQAEFVGESKMFQQIDSNVDGSIGAIEAAAVSRLRERKNDLSGHFFLGPPLPVDGCLFAVTEADRQLNLVALKPETGEVLWAQGLGFVELPIESDAKRYWLSCSPSFAVGVLVCPTQLGILVGVDSSTGTLLWAYYYGDQQSFERFSRWPGGSGRTYGHSGFPAVPQIKANRVVMLPRQSAFVHCVDLFTGQGLWKVPRKDGEYVGTIQDEIVLIVGNRVCRGLSLQTGEEQWQTRLGLPCGRGLCIGERYLVPLQEGRVATLELSSGHEIGFTLSGIRGNSHFENGESVPTAGSPLPSATGAETSRDSWRPGNLVACQGMILSAGTRGVTAFPQAGSLLGHVQQKLEQAPDSPKELLLAAELKLALGHIAEAHKHLTLSMTKRLSRHQRGRAERLMRELLYLQLQQPTLDDRAIFAQLDQLSKTPSLRARFLMQRAESELRRGEFGAVLKTTRKFAALELSEPLPMAGDPSLLVTAASWVPSIIGRVQQQFGNEDLARVQQQIDIAQQQTLNFGDTDRLEQFVAVYAHWPQAAAPRLKLARRYIDKARFQQAELLLLENRSSRDPNTAAVAAATLAQLWDRLGLWQQAAEQLADLKQGFADVQLENGQTGSEFAASFAPESLTRHALRQRNLPAWNVGRVRISERGWVHADPKLAETYGRYQRRFETPPKHAFRLLDKGIKGKSRLAVIDRLSGTVVGRISIPTQISYPSQSKNSHVGHFLPLGSTANMHGISLLQRKSEQPLWTTTPHKFLQQKERMQVGPARPSFCTFQARRHLVVVEPGNGRILWQRTDLDPNSGMLSDPYAGLFGDEQVLVLFASDRETYTVYHTATGQELRRGKLQVDTGRQRRVFGRKLFHVANSTSGRRLRIWDPLTDRMEFDEPLTGRLFTAVNSEREFAVILPPGRLLVIDVATGEKRLDFRLQPEDLANLNYLRFFADRERYYINLQRAAGVRSWRKYSYYTSDTFLDAVHIQGDLYTVNRQTGKLDWKRTLPQRSVIHTPHIRLPFLVTMSGVRDRWNGSRQSLLVEIIDAKTGETLALLDNIFPDRIVQFSYLPDQSRVELRGLKTVIDIEFKHGRESPLLSDGPF